MSRPFRLKPALALATLVSAAAGCGATDPQEDRVVTWHLVEWSGGVTRVAVLPPQEIGAAPHPLIFALSWGSGSADLVLGFLDTYWAIEPGNRGYYVVAPEVTGSTLDQIADDFLPAIFEWMDEEVPYDRTQVALVGASNGGRGIFHAALSQPERFHAMVGLPGRYSGDASALSALAGMPVWLIVGEHDAGWVEGSRATADALEAAGAQVTLEILEGQGHVLAISPGSLMDRIDAGLGR